MRIVAFAESPRRCFVAAVGTMVYCVKSQNTQTGKNWMMNEARKL